MNNMFMGGCSATASFAATGCRPTIRSATMTMREGDWDWILI